MPAFDLRPFCSWILDEFEPLVRLPGGAGHYARAVGQTEPELYGVSDMACVLSTLDELRPTDDERRQWAEAFRLFQDPQTGYLVERSPTHDKLHNTAFALGAMQLLGLTPRHPLVFAVQFNRPAKVRAFLASLDWRERVYKDSHRGAGVGSIVALAPELAGSRAAFAAWFDTYFEACDALFDPANGMMGAGKPPGGDSDQVGGTFHYHFLYEHFHRRMPHPAARIDAVIGLQQPDGYWHPTNHLWLTLDAVYLLTRTVRHHPHRREDIERVVRRVLDVIAEDVLSPAGRERHFMGHMGVHSLTATTNLLAEIQMHLGADQVITHRPLRPILDRRPFI